MVVGWHDGTTVTLKTGDLLTVRTIEPHVEMVHVTVDTPVLLLEVPVDCDCTADEFCTHDSERALRLTAQDAINLATALLREHNLAVTGSG